MDWLKSTIGKATNFYIGKDLGGVQKKRIKRAGLKPPPAAQYRDVESFTTMMLDRFKPLWIRAVVAAQNDIKGFVTTQIKNHAFMKAKPKIDRLHQLDQLVSALEGGRTLDKNTDTSMYNMIGTPMHDAILMAAHHFYPETSRGFTDRARQYGSRARASLNDYDAVRLLFNDIRDGDVAKISTVLAFFKRGLIAG